MKKIISIILILALAAGFAACLHEEDPIAGLSTVPPLTDEQGSTILESDPNKEEITTVAPLLTDLPTEPTVPATAPPASTGKVSGTTKPTAPPATTKPKKAQLYPASSLYKSLKSNKFYLEVIITNFDKKGVKTDTNEMVRARDGKKQYMRGAVAEGVSPTLLKDESSLTVMIPATGKNTSGSNSDFLKALGGVVGKNAGIYIKIDKKMMEEAGADISSEELASMFSEIDTLFTDTFDNLFLDVGSYQGLTTQTLSGKKYNIETFKKEGSTVKVYFSQDDGEVKLLQMIKPDGSYSIANINALKPSAEARFFRVPAGYVEINKDNFETISNIFSGLFS